MLLEELYRAGFNPVVRLGHRSESLRKCLKNRSSLVVLYGVSDRGQPQTYDDFLAYWDEMLDRFVPHKTVLYGTGYIRKGIPGPRRIPKPVWKILSAPLNAYTRLVVVGTLPPQMREVCQLEWDAKKEKRFQRVAAAIRALNPLLNRLPVRVLYTSWAAKAWQRAGVDPRRLHNRPAA